jgi:hypothetical protein
MVLAESAFSSVPQAVASCVSHSVGSVHFALGAFATPQKSPAASGAGSELHAASTRIAVTVATAPIARATFTKLTRAL